MENNDTVQGRFEKMRRVLNFGSINIDNVYTVEHFVRPGETISALEMEVFPGGKGLNQSVALARAGAEVYHAGKIGKDGAFLLQLLRSVGVDVSCVETINGKTGKAIIQVEEASGENCILLYHGANWQMTELYIDEVLSGFSGQEIVVVQNEINHVSYLLEKAWKKGMAVAFNPSPVQENLKDCNLEHVTWLILNEVEGQALTGKEQPEEMIQTLLDRYPALKIVLTIGKQGAVYADKETCFHQPACDAEVVDTTGAGDTFAGYFIAAMARGDSPRQAMQEASRASAIAVSRPGAAVSIPTRDEVLES